jgi:hypothetical protein
MVKYTSMVGTTVLTNQIKPDKSAALLLPGYKAGVLLLYESGVFYTFPKNVKEQNILHIQNFAVNMELEP